MSIQRFFVEISYDGTPYHGWQIQLNAITVQECLDKALTTIFRQKVETLGCGRTDTGVHATAFFAHFDLTDITQEKVLAALEPLNALLPNSIAAKRFIKVANQAHARFDAIARTYHYKIHFHKNPFKENRSWLCKWPLDTDKMDKAAQTLITYADFSSFSKAYGQTFTNNCKVTEVRFEQTAEELLFVISADRFLRNMVRAIMGTLIKIGRGEVSLEQFHQIIESKNRSNAGQSVAACGLYLVKVRYPYINE